MTSPTTTFNGRTQASAERLAEFEARFVSERKTRTLWTLFYVALFVCATIGSMIVSGFNIQKLVTGMPKAWNYVHGTFPTLTLDNFLGDVRSWYWGINYWMRLLVETVLMGFTGTALGGVVGLLFCFAASRNLVENSWLYFVARRALEFFRTVPELVFALIFVFAFGLGPFAGVLAIAVHTAGALGKLFAEVNENVDMRPVEGVRAAGGNWPMIMRLAVMPQALPNYASYALLRFEINVRGAAVLGVVGAGGIGQDLYFAIRQFEYQDISAILLLLIATVAIIDLICETSRHLLIGQDLVKGK